MKKILITGCNGQLGLALNQRLAGREDLELINTDVEQLDITNIDAVMALVEKEKPYAIINCAAHTGVDACETQEELAYRINAIGPRNLSIAATRVGAKMMQISTDYVFKGDGNTPLTEFDAPGPQGVYGKTKFAGENFVKEFSKEYFILRTAWLYGEGKNFVKTMLRLSETYDTVRVIDDQFGTPTSAKELARAIDYLLLTDNYGTFHATCEGECSWADFAEEIFRLAGKDTKVQRITTEEYGPQAPRPKYGVLDKMMFRLTTDFKFADWHDAIAEYIDEMN